MKKLILTMVMAIAILNIYAQEGSKNFIDQNYIEVTGHAEKEVTPDRIFLKIILNEKDFKNMKLAEIETLMIQKLTEIGINVTESLTIKDYVSNFKNYWIIKKDISLIKEYELLVKDAKTAGLVFQELEKLEISNISIDRLEHSEIDKYELEVKVSAMKSAQEKAQAIVKSINQEIGRAILIQETPDYSQVQGMLQGRAAGLRIRGIGSFRDSSSYEETNIEFEKIQLDYNLVVRFELK